MMLSAFASRLTALCLVASLLPTLHAQSVSGTTLAPTPPMGWNSWDSFGPSVREDEVKANTNVMATRLAKYGWQYVTVDIEWYAPDAHANGYIPRGRVVLDQYGRFQPAVNRFPAAADGEGFKPLAAYVHSKGLKFGIHIMRGISREAVEKNLPIEGSKYHAADIADKVNICHWSQMEDTYGVDMSKPGAQDYYDSIARLYAEWGVDLVKADDMSRPFHEPEIHALSVALKKTGRPIVLSLSPGPAPIANYPELKANAQMWRISDDFWDRWIDVKDQFDRAHLWESNSQPGGWPDADMLPLGHIAIRGERGVDRNSLLTHDEQITLMTLWSIFRSPLIFGGDLSTSDAFTFSLLTNPEVLAVDQASSHGRQVYRSDDIIAWTADEGASGGKTPAKYVAVFNTGDTARSVHLSWKSLGMDAQTAGVRDLWAQQAVKNNVADAEALHTSVAPHASLFYKVDFK